jgi:hypothetical protein
VAQGPNSCCIFSASCCLLPAICCLLPAACCLLPAVRCPLSDVCCLLSALSSMPLFFSSIPLRNLVVIFKGLKALRNFLEFSTHSSLYIHYFLYDVDMRSSFLFSQMTVYPLHAKMQRRQRSKNLD